MVAAGIKKDCTMLNLRFIILNFGKVWTIEIIFEWSQIILTIWKTQGEKSILLECSKIFSDTWTMQYEKKKKREILDMFMGKHVGRKRCL